MINWNILYYGIGIYLGIGLLFSLITLNSMIKMINNASDDDDDETKEMVEEMTTGIEAVGEKFFIVTYIFLTTFTWLKVIIDSVSQVVNEQD